MVRLPLIRTTSGLLGVGALIAGCVLLAGCASARVAPGGSPGTTAASTGLPSGPASVVPPSSLSPSGPAATAATGSPPPAATHATAHVDSLTIDCPAESPAPARASRTPLPAKVALRAVVRCEEVQRTYAGLGESRVQLAEVATSGFDQLLTELRKPSQTASANQICRAVGYVVPWFVLVTTDGSVLVPSVPTGVCGEPSPAAMRALGALDFRAVDAVRVQLIRSPESIASQCEQNWKDEVALEGAQQSGGNSAASVGDLASSPSSVLLCLYEAGPLQGGLRAGGLIKGVTVTGDTAGRLASEAEIANPVPGGCVDADRFVVVHFDGRWASVEIGGCHRLLTPDRRFGTASGHLVADLGTALQLS